MRFKIDKEKSIQKNRLILAQNSLDKYYDVIAFLALIIIFPSFSIWSIFTSTIDKENILGYIIGLLLALTFSFIAIIGRIESRKLIIMKGKNEHSNRTRIQELIKQEKWSITDHINDTDYIIPRDIQNQILVIYVGDLIYISVVTFGWGDLISPLRIFNTDGLRDKLIIKLEQLGFTTPSQKL